MDDRPAKIQSAGVMRCCLTSVGCYKASGFPYTKPKEGDTDKCQYCGRTFRLDHDRTWRPVNS